MNIASLLKNKDISFSCEVFPPKDALGFAEAAKVIKEIAALKPDYMSVTCGASGSGAVNNLEVAREIQNVNATTALAHLTCVVTGRQTIDSDLAKLKELGVSNILALRGDLPKDFLPRERAYEHASDLMADIRARGGFSIGGACYPEGHPEAQSLDADIENTKIKVDNGCEFLVTQMFFDNNILYNYLYRLLKAGIEIPVTAGIMPVTNAKSIWRIVKLSGCSLPKRFRAIVERFGDDPAAMLDAGIAYATDQIIDLIANGVNNIHLYTMNKPLIAARIFDNLSNVIGRGK